MNEFTTTTTKSKISMVCVVLFIYLYVAFIARFRCWTYIYGHALRTFVPSLHRRHCHCRPIGIDQSICQSGLRCY